MYRPQAYVIDDESILHEVMRQRSFATIAAIVEGHVQFAYAPVVVDVEPHPLGAVRFHLARGNPLAQVHDAELRLSFLGPDAYVSPDWYEGRGFVPTWNYIAVEACGRAQGLEESELRQLLADLSARHEERLRPKPPWTMDKISEARMAALLRGIRGFALKLDSLEGEFKLSQDKMAADITGVMAGLEARGDAASLAAASAMRERWAAVPRV
ncbi:MAG TPA: FMN-binding negative transcriptional regulator [Rhizomicrobium sp.]|jgi:transcriptional regulator|nr:FMN-binding negative transcriptional regulator [Rhizomicrobium sp.]